MILLSSHLYHRMPGSIWTLTSIHFILNSITSALCPTTYSMIFHYNTLTAVDTDDKKSFIWIATLSFHCTHVFHFSLPQLFQSLCFNDFMKSFPLCLWGGPIFLMGEIYLNCLRDVFALPACRPRICETRNSIKNLLNLLASIYSLGRNNFD